MKRLTGERAVGVAVLVFAAVVALAVWFLVHQERTRIVRPRVTVTMPAKKAPARKATPKRSKKRTASPKRTPTGVGSSGARANSTRPSVGSSPRSPARTAPFKRKKRPATQSPSQPSPSPQGTPSAPQKPDPPVVIKTPGGTPSICTPVARLNDC